MAEQGPAQGHKASVGTVGTVKTANTVLKHDEVQVLPVTKKQKAARHCRMHWWKYVVGVVIILAIVLPCFFVVIIPAIIQNTINHAVLPVRRGSMQAISDNEVRIALTTELTTPGSLTVRLSGFELELYDVSSKNVMLTVLVPEQVLAGTTAVDIPEQTVAVRDAAAMRAWFGATFEAVNATVGVRGRTEAHLGSGLSYPVVIDKHVQMPGLRALAGVNVTSVEPAAVAAPDGTNVAGELMIPNYSPLDLALGNVSYGVYVGDLKVGETIMNNLLMRTGNHTYGFSGQMWVDTIKENIQTILTSQGEAMAAGNVGFRVIGNQSTVNGQRISYLDDVLAKIDITALVPMDVAMKTVSGGSA